MTSRANRFWTYCITAAICFGEPSLVVGQDVSGEQRADLLRLMEVTGAMEMGEQMGNASADQMIAMLTATQPDVPPRAFEIIREVSSEFMAEAFTGPDGMLEDLIKVHARHLSPADTRAVLAFYDTPVGRRLTEALPDIARESMQVGQAWGERMGPGLEARLVERFRAEGLMP